MEFNKIIFVFDFDLTLTFKSAHGFNKYNDYIELFESNDKIELLKTYFKQIKNNGNLIYLNTRGMVTDVIKILKIIGIKVGENEIIKEVKGSERIEEINTPFTELDKIRYKIADINNIDILWGIKKVIILNYIREHEKVNINNILFFDDSNININIAIMNGYNNSFIIGNNDSGLIGLDYLLVKLNQILELSKKNK